MKYVILNHLGIEFPVLSAGLVNHSDLVPFGMVPVSAGFFTLSRETGEVTTHGESESLSLKPRPQDKVLIQICIEGLEALLPILPTVDDAVLEQLRHTPIMDSVFRGPISPSAPSALSVVNSSKSELCVYES